MAKTKSDDDAAAEAAAAAAEAARIAEIEKKISDLQDKITGLNNTKQLLSNNRTDVGNQIQKWKDAKTTFNNEDIARFVVIKNTFEGQTADAVKSKNEEVTGVMDGKISAAESVKDGITTQISRINSKITTLNTQILNLKKEI